MKTPKTTTNAARRKRPDPLWLELLIASLGGRAVWNAASTPGK